MVSPLAIWQRPLSGWLLILLLALSGCAGLGGSRASGGCVELERDERLSLNAVRQTAGEGRLHAALAQLETLPEQAVEVRLLKADIARRLRRDEQAAELYRQLLGGCMEGQALHGLGLLAAGQGDLQAAEQRLTAARQRLPVEPRVRSDLGYVLLLEQRHDEARFELQTALELDPDNRRAARNLLLLHLSRQELEQASELMRHLKLDAEGVARVERELLQLEEHWRGVQPRQ